MGSTGDPPVPSGDSPLGMGESQEQAVAIGGSEVAAVSSGQWPDDTGSRRVGMLPKEYEICGLNAGGDPAQAGQRDALPFACWTIWATRPQDVPSRESSEVFHRIALESR